MQKHYFCFFFCSDCATLLFLFDKTSTFSHTNDALHPYDQRDHSYTVTLPHHQIITTASYSIPHNKVTFLTTQIIKVALYSIHHNKATLLKKIERGTFLLQLNVFASYKPHSIIIKSRDIQIIIVARHNPAWLPTPPRRTA